MQRHQYKAVKVVLLMDYEAHRYLWNAYEPVGHKLNVVESTNARVSPIDDVRASSDEPNQLRSVSAVDVKATNKKRAQDS